MPEILRLHKNRYALFISLRMTVIEVPLFYLVYSTNAGDSSPLALTLILIIVYKLIQMPLCCELPNYTINFAFNLFLCRCLFLFVFLHKECKNLPLLLQRTRMLRYILCRPSNLCHILLGCQVHICYNLFP